MFGLMHDVFGPGIEGVLKPDFCFVGLKLMDTDAHDINPPFDNLRLEFFREAFVGQKEGHGDKPRQGVPKGRWLHLGILQDSLGFLTRPLEWCL